MARDGPVWNATPGVHRHERGSAVSVHNTHARRWRLLAVAVVTGLAVVSVPAGPASADEDPGQGGGDTLFAVAYQGSNGDLWTVDQNGTPRDTGLGMADHTSPAALES